MTQQLQKELQQKAVVQQQPQLQLATLFDQMQAMHTKNDERLQQERLEKIANSERFSTSVAHLLAGEDTNS